MKSSKILLNGITNLRDAKLAGTTNSNLCTLILILNLPIQFTEIGSQILDRDKYGIFRIQGHLINPRTGLDLRVQNNDQIKNIIKITGLRYGQTYADTSTLRYNRIILLADNTADGAYAKSLFMNFIDYFWPSLSKINGFISDIKIPMCQIQQKETLIPISFHSMSEYESWKQSNDTKLYTEPQFYYKLESLNQKEIENLFEDFESNLVTYYNDMNDEINMELAFGKGTTYLRKIWLGENDKILTTDPNERHVSYANFINTDVKQYYYDNIKRAIPSVCDGLKPSSRKILSALLHPAFLKKREMRLDLFSLYTAEKMAYLHGNTTLQNIIIEMAKLHNINWLLSMDNNNIRLGELTPFVFNKTDECVYEYEFYEHNQIEPRFFSPIICTVLANGAEGISTAFSTSIPSFNPQDIINNLRLLLANDKPYTMLPWYKGFGGTIVPTEPGKYDIFGTYEILNKNTCVITELPVGIEISRYEEYLNNLREGQLLKSWIREQQTRFTLVFTDGKLQELIDTDGIIKKLRLVTHISTNNMHLFDSQHKIKKFDTAESILIEYYHFRLNTYNKRIACYSRLLVHELKLVDQKIKFVEYFANGNLKLESDMIQQLTNYDFEKISNSFDYLLEIKIVDLTEENINKLREQHNKIKAELEIYLHTTPQQLWLDELTDFEKKYQIL